MEMLTGVPEYGDNPFDWPEEESKPVLDERYTANISVADLLGLSLSKEGGKQQNKKDKMT